MNARISANRILITGGAGFVGSSLALSIKRDHSHAEVRVMDNLVRRGSELALSRLTAAGVEFSHGDVRCKEDLEALPPFDVLIDCSAEPSVQAGYGGGARALVHTNFNGTLNCLEQALEHGAAVIFLSTSRVYPISALRDLPLEPGDNRLFLPESSSGQGWSAEGISRDFPMDGARSLYGATKLCSEHLAEEYCSMYGLPVVVNRCGVLTGPWQMGRVDQGFFVLWAARHLYGGNLSYNGFGGEGLQVRDVLHVEDLYQLVRMQLAAVESHAGATYCVGGGTDQSISLRELTQLCEQHTGNRLDIGSLPETHPSDIPYYVTDNREVHERTGWSPQRNIDQTLGEVFDWLRENESVLRPILSPKS